MAAMRAAFFLVVLIAMLPAVAQQEDESAKRTIAALEALLRERPQDPTLWFYLSRFQAQAGDRAASVAALEKVLEIGNGFLPSRDGFETVWEDKAFQALRAKLEAKLPRLDYAPRAFEIDDTLLIPEGIAYDPHSQNFFVGSIAKRKIVRVGAASTVTDFAGADAGLDPVLGLTVDAPRRTLYAVSTSALTAEGEKRARNTIVAFDVDTGRLLRRAEVPAARQLNDVTVARGGRVFASDSLSGAVYEIPKEGEAREIVPPGIVRASNGIAASPDGNRLYVAHSTGIAVVDLASKAAVRRVAVPERETVAGIDGLYEWQGQLIGVQNVTNPGRVILMTLSADGNAITRVQTLLSHHHNALYEPTTGAVTPKGFFLLAATGIRHFNRDGILERTEALPKPTVLRIPLPR
jgi:hypothetical protein